MPGLIPFMLNAETAGTRQSVLYSPAPRSPVEVPDSSFKRAAPPSTKAFPAPPPRRPARLSIQPPPPALEMLPYTPVEWAKAVAEVKRLYLYRRYRPCSARCAAILDNIKDTVSHSASSRRRLSPLPVLHSD
jgi:hypothetical protein